MIDLREAADSLLNARVTVVSPTEAEQIGRKHFGIDATACSLSSERDSNFSMLARDGRRYLLRVTNPQEDPLVTSFQTAALRHLEAYAPDLPVPRIVVSRDGTQEVAVALSDGRSHVVRMMSFLPGQPLSTVARPSAYRVAVAQALAELDAGLHGFDHPAAEHDLLWNVAKAARVRPMLEAVTDGGRRRLAERLLDEYEAFAVPRLSKLRSQVIHNDFNPSNILVVEDGGARVSGIIDFGDAIKAPLVNDLATAAAYQPLGDRAAVEALCEFVAAFHGRLPLKREEVDVLLDLVRARQVMVAAITEWRAARQPDNRDYILRNNAHAWASLKKLACVERLDAQHALYRACGLE